MREMLFVPTGKVVTFLDNRGWAPRPGEPSMFAHAYQPNLPIQLDAESEMVAIDLMVEEWTRDGMGDLAQMLFDCFT